MPNIIYLDMAKAAKGETPSSKKVLFELDSTLLRKIKYIAFTEEAFQVSVVSKALTEYVEKWEKKNGPVPLK